MKNSILQEVENFYYQIDEILFESFPPIFLEAPPEIKRDISKVFSIGPNSKQKEITRADAIRAPYDKGLIVTTDEDFKPVAFIIGTTIIPAYEAEEHPSRARALKVAAHIYYISPDLTTAQRTDRPKEKPYNPEEVRKEKFKKLYGDYQQKKFDEIKRFAVLLKNKVEKLMKENMKAYIDSGYDEYFGEKYSELTKAFSKYDNALNHFQEMNMADMDDEERKSTLYNLTNKRKILEELLKKS